MGAGQRAQDYISPLQVSAATGAPLLAHAAAAAPASLTPISAAAQHMSTVPMPPNMIAAQIGQPAQQYQVRL